MYSPSPSVYALVAGLCFSAAAPFAKILGPETTPLMLAALFLLGSAIGTTGYAIFLHLCGQKRSSIEAPITRGDLPWLFAVTLFSSLLPTLLVVYGVAETTATTASFLFSFEGVTTIFVACFLFREAIGRRIWAAVVCITCACMIMSLGDTGDFGLHISYGAACILLACFSWGIANNCIRMISGVDPIYQTLVRSWVGGLVLFGLALASGEMLPSIFVFLCAVVCGFIAYGGLASIFFVYGVRGLGSARATAYFSINPLFGIVLSMIIFQTLPEITLWIALPFLLFGLWLLLTEAHQHIHVHDMLIHEHRHQHQDMHHDDARHVHGPGNPELDRFGYHSHLHEHETVAHSHPHHPDVHHWHEHEKSR
ncbi:MAG: EamA family transporter [Methanomicrobiales archaeon]|nr:EamA family transporter [Methanomicrobiales archaeon]